MLKHSQVDPRSPATIIKIKKHLIKFSSHLGMFC